MRATRTRPRQQQFRTSASGGGAVWTHSLSLRKNPSLRVHDMAYGTTSFAPSDKTGQAACDHFLDICERKMGLSTCLKLEKFTMGEAS